MCTQKQRNKETNKTNCQNSFELEFTSKYRTRLLVCFTFMFRPFTPSHIKLFSNVFSFHCTNAQIALHAIALSVKVFSVFVHFSSSLLRASTFLNLHIWLSSFFKKHACVPACLRACVPACNFFLNTS